MAMSNTPLMVQARRLLEERGADLTTNKKSLIFWEEENGPVAGGAENK